MTILKRIGFAALGAALMATPALAAGNAATAVVVAPAPAPVFDWSGYYLGAFAPVYSNDGELIFGVGGAAGYNFVRGRLVFGLESYVTALFFGPPDYDLVGRFRAGLLVTPKVLTYGAVGFGIYASGGHYTHLGIGTEFAAGNALSIRAELAAYRYPTTDWDFHVAVGAVWHLGH